MFDSEAFNSRLFFPRRAASPTPAGARELTVEVDGAALHLRWYRAATQLPVVLMFHGNGEVVADYDDLESRFAASLAVVDYRGYGQSTGTPTLRALLADAGRALEAVKRETGTRRLFVIGRSLGSACAVELYGQSPAGVAGFIIDSGFSQLEGLIRRRGLVATPTDEERTAFDPLPKLARGNAALLVLHGEDDTAIPVGEGRELCDAAGTTQKAFEPQPGFGHNDLFGSERYWQLLNAFLNR